MTLRGGSAARSASSNVRGRPTGCKATSVATKTDVALTLPIPAGGEEILADEALDFVPQTREIREDGSWRVAPAPRDLWNRRVEITGPVERKMMINALNSGAQVFMADFEDASSPTWENCVLGHRNLIDAIDRTIS